MSLAFFYLSTYHPGDDEITLDEDNSRHIVQVLRMQKGQALQLTDGYGRLLTATILDDHKKKCRVRIDNSQLTPAREKHVTIAISLLKNTSRFEWFLEKATEIGVSGIIPLLAHRTEKQHFRQDRMQSILVSALLQSQQTWLPVLHPPTPVMQVIGEAKQKQRLIAHCMEDSVLRPLAEFHGLPDNNELLMLIGPEGDFTSDEIKAAVQKDFAPVSLGKNRLRTETAGIVAATLLCI